MALPPGVRFATADDAAPIDANAPSYDPDVPAQPDRPITWGERASALGIGYDQTRADQAWARWGIAMQQGDQAGADAAFDVARSTDALNKYRRGRDYSPTTRRAMDEGVFGSGMPWRAASQGLLESGYGMAEGAAISAVPFAVGTLLGTPALGAIASRVVGGAHEGYGAYGSTLSGIYQMLEALPEARLQEIPAYAKAREAGRSHDQAIGAVVSELGNDIAMTTGVGTGLAGAVFGEGEAVARPFLKPTIRQAVGGYLKRVGASAAGEALEEMIQSANEAYGRERGVKAAIPEHYIDPWNIGKEALEGAAVGALGGGILGAIPGRRGERETALPPQARAPAPAVPVVPAGSPSPAELAAITAATPPPYNTTGMRGHTVLQEPGEAAQFQGGAVPLEEEPTAPPTMQGTIRAQAFRAGPPPAAGVPLEPDQQTLVDTLRSQIPDRWLDVYDQSMGNPAARQSLASALDRLAQEWGIDREYIAHAFQQALQARGQRPPGAGPAAPLGAAPGTPPPGPGPAPPPGGAGGAPPQGTPPAGPAAPGGAAQPPPGGPQGAARSQQQQALINSLGQRLDPSWLQTIAEDPNPQSPRRQYVDQQLQGLADRFGVHRSYVDAAVQQAMGQRGTAPAQPYQRPPEPPPPYQPGPGEGPTGPQYPGPPPNAPPGIPTEPEPAPVEYGWDMGRVPSAGTMASPASAARPASTTAGAAAAPTAPATRPPAGPVDDNFSAADLERAVARAVGGTKALPAWKDFIKALKGAAQIAVGVADAVRRTNAPRSFRLGDAGFQGDERVGAVVPDTLLSAQEVFSGLLPRLIPLNTPVRVEVGGETLTAGDVITRVREELGLMAEPQPTAPAREEAPAAAPVAPRPAPAPRQPLSGQPRVESAVEEALGEYDLTRPQANNIIKQVMDLIHQYLQSGVGGYTNLIYVSKAIRDALQATEDGQAKNRGKTLGVDKKARPVRVVDVLSRAHEILMGEPVAATEEQERTTSEWVVADTPPRTAEQSREDRSKIQFEDYDADEERVMYGKQAPSEGILKAVMRRLTKEKKRVTEQDIRREAADEMRRRRKASEAAMKAAGVTPTPATTTRVTTGVTVPEPKKVREEGAPSMRRGRRKAEQREEVKEASVAFREKRMVDRIARAMRLFPDSVTRRARERLDALSTKERTRLFDALLWSITDVVKGEKELGTSPEKILVDAAKRLKVPVAHVHAVLGGIYAEKFPNRAASKSLTAAVAAQTERAAKKAPAVEPVQPVSPAGLGGRAEPRQDDTEGGTRGDTGAQAPAAKPAPGQDQVAIGRAIKQVGTQTSPNGLVNQTLDSNELVSAVITPDGKLYTVPEHDKFGEVLNEHGSAVTARPQLVEITGFLGEMGWREPTNITPQQRAMTNLVRGAWNKRKRERSLGDITTSPWADIVRNPEWQENQGAEMVNAVPEAAAAPEPEPKKKTTRKRTTRAKAKEAAEVVPAVDTATDTDVAPTEDAVQGAVNGEQASYSAEDQQDPEKAKEVEALSDAGATVMDFRDVLALLPPASPGVPDYTTMGQIIQETTGKVAWAHLTDAEKGAVEMAVREYVRNTAEQQPAFGIFGRAERSRANQVAAQSAEVIADTADDAPSAEQWQARFDNEKKANLKRGTLTRWIRQARMMQRQWEPVDEMIRNALAQGPVNARQLLSAMGDLMRNPLMRNAVRELAQKVPDDMMVTNTRMNGAIGLHVPGGDKRGIHIDLAELARIRATPEKGTTTGFGEGIVLLHEMLHAATAPAIRALSRKAVSGPSDTPSSVYAKHLIRVGRELLMEANRVAKEAGLVPVRDQTTGKLWLPENASVSFAYATDLHELISYALSDPHFQTVMNETPLSPELQAYVDQVMPQSIFGKISNLYQLFRNWIGAMLGMTRPAERTLLDAVIRFAEAMPESNRVLQMIEDGIIQAPVNRPISVMARFDPSEMGDVQPARSRLQDGAQAVIDTVINQGPQIAQTQFSSLSESAQRGTLGMMTMEQIGDWFRRHFDRGADNALTRTINAVEQKANDAMQRIRKDDAIIRQWEELKRSNPEANKEMMTLMKRGTELMYDPAEPLTHETNSRATSPTQRALHAEDAARFNALPDAAKTLYKTVRDDYKERHTREHRLMIRNILADDPAMRGETSLDDNAWRARMDAHARDILSGATNLDELPISTGRLREIRAIAGAHRSAPGVYFPLRRVGDYVLNYRTDVERIFDTQEEANAFISDQPTAFRHTAQERLLDGRVKLSGRLQRTEMFETMREASLRRAELAQQIDEGGGDVGDLSDVLLKRDSPVLPVMPKAIYDQISNAIKRAYPDGGGGNLQRIIDEQVIRSMPETFIQKAMLQRRYIAGAMEDMQRAYAMHSVSSAQFMSQLEHGWKISQGLRDMKQVTQAAEYNYGREGTQRQLMGVTRELERRIHAEHEYQRPSMIAQRGTEMAQLWFLTSPSYYAIQVTQPWVTGAPLMAARYNWRDTVAELGKATKMITPRALLEGMADMKDKLMGKAAPINILDDFMASLRERGREDLADMLKVLADRGRIDYSQVQELYQQARGATSGLGKAWEKSVEFGRVMSHATEIANRSAVAIAAYELARKNGKSVEQATEEAAEFVSKSQFNYQDWNKARYMNPKKIPELKLMWQFKQHAQHMYALLVMNGIRSVKGGTPAEKREARRAVLGLLGTHLAMSGVNGVMFEPIAWAIGFALWAFTDDDEDMETIIANFLSDVLGKDLGDAVAKGLPRLAGVDLSQRVSLKNLMFMNDIKDIQRDGLAAFIGRFVGGAALSPAMDLGRALEAMSVGDARALEYIVPKAVRDLWRAGRFADEGVLDTNGHPIMKTGDMSFYDFFVQSMGFRPSSVALAQERRSAILNAQKAAETQRSNILERWARGDGATRAGLSMSDIPAFNRRFPDLKIDADVLQRSMEARRKRDINMMRNQGVYVPDTQRGFLGYGRFGV